MPRSGAMREKELRIALVCYGGVSLAVYMHGITKEIWRLAKASRAFHAGAPPEAGSETVYHRMLADVAARGGMSLRVLVDILAGASAGGINAIFLAHAIAAGRPLDPLSDLWLDSADVDRLVDPEVSGLSRFAKGAAVPFAWALAARSGTVERTVEPEHRAEVRAKLANFVRARWFAPPFGGTNLTNLVLDAFEAMDKGPAGPPLLPDHQPLDLFVTVTDFRGFPEKLRLNSPAEVLETEHRVTLAFRDPGGTARRIAHPAELTYAARATASFPGAFPPFTVRELDAALAERGAIWPTREAFLARVLPRHAALGLAEEAILIDGSVLANAPFRPAIDALENRPARREVDRRFVYIDPKPGLRSVRLTGPGEDEPPGFFATIFGAMSDIPREQPIRDNLEAIEALSARIRRMRRIVETMRPEVEAAVERALGSGVFMLKPTAKRLAGWRARAHELAAREAGYAYAAYGQLKIAAVVEAIALAAAEAGGADRRGTRDAVRGAIWAEARRRGLSDSDAVTARGARADVVTFLRDFDLAFRVRRLRFVARAITESLAGLDTGREQAEALRTLAHEAIDRYRTREAAARTAAVCPACTAAAENPADAMAALARALDLKALDDDTDARLAEALAGLGRRERGAILLTYLGYPFYDVATLPLLQGEGLEEYDPIKVDRISPQDAASIRSDGPEATLKGIQFNSFGAFFSRAYRENDYLWGRLHGAERMIDITLSTLPDGRRPPDAETTALKRAAFRAILEEERDRLTAIPGLFAALAQEIG